MNGQHAQTMPRLVPPTSSQKACRHPNAPAIGLKRHNLHEAISQSTLLLHPASEEDHDVRRGRLDSPNGPAQEAMRDARVCRSRLKAVWLRGRSAGRLSLSLFKETPTHRSSPLQSNILIEYLWLPVLPCKWKPVKAHLSRSSTSLICLLAAHQHQQPHQCHVETCLF